MANPDQKFEFRCPVHGFIKLNGLERDIVQHTAFQRLRRIRQLAWTDYIYPGAMHTRFEHSLGVLHVATLLFEAIEQNSKDVLRSELLLTDDGWGRHRQIVRLAALLHDVGHGPFSHAGEDVMPLRDDGEARFAHEDYSAAIIRNVLNEVIDSHPLNTANWSIRADDIAALIEGTTQASQHLFWRDLISGQMDADRMDYLLRDSLHAGVQYGRYDLNRLLSTIVAIPFADRGPRLGVEEGGWHAAEALVLARYSMFTQVYFHRTRVAYDVHFRCALSALLPDGLFPRPDTELNEYLRWDDWRVLGLLAGGEGGEHGDRIRARNHFREIYHTSELTSPQELERLGRVKDAVGDLIVHEEKSDKSWYKTGGSDIPVSSDTLSGRIDPLSRHSNVVANLKSILQYRIYVRPEDVPKATSLKEHALNENEGADHGGN